MDEKLELRSPSDTGGGAPAWRGDHQFSLLPATTRQDEVPRQGKILTTTMLLVFSCLLLHTDYVLCVCALSVLTQ